ncbi:YdcF family protein [Acidithiobacillus concretivorus]|uniref:YdcF family protein n=1 Tax=Acidithiobacillus concretivorus TaxID=3063952 RepID=A0ABS5ZMW0_9PROT|nr:YdcF family protein [Acidithiobacillus concretivorus]MBU2737825.1 YdcF family protein [Acidithiobacillus concretivorus]
MLLRYTTVLTLASALLQPPGVLFLLAMFGWLSEVLGWRYMGRTLIILALGILYFFSTAIGARLLLMPLENRYPTLHQPLTGAERPGAIVVLGGGEVMDSPHSRQETANARTLVRLMAAARLARQTQLPVVPSGGAPRFGVAAEATTMAHILRQDFHVTSPIWPETHSYNTAANAADSSILLAAHHIQKIYLVTSALHMPRAVAWFSLSHLEVIPVPTDYRLNQVRELKMDSWLPRAIFMEISSEACHEYLGLLWLWLQEQGLGNGN